jgi:hypothetical protein
MTTELLALDGLIDAQTMARQQPTTYEVPDDQELADISVGDCVKVCRCDERFWILITETSARYLVGEVNSQLIAPDNLPLKVGQLVRFERRHVFAADPVS